MVRPRSPKLEAKARRLRGKGVSFRQIAEQCKRSEAWARHVCAKDPLPTSAGEGQGAPAEPEPPETPPALAEPTDADRDVSTLEELRDMIRAARRSARLAEAEGNHSAAQRYARDVAGMLTTKARLEKAQGDDDLVQIPRAEAAAAMLQFRDRFKALQARPLMCSHCGKELRLAIAKAGREE